MGKRVVLTGAAGFIGRAAVPHLLERGFEVCEFGRSPSGVPGTSHYPIDLLREDPSEPFAAIAPTHLLHLAWCTDPGQFWFDPANVDWVGVSARLLSAFAKARGDRAVLAGTCAEYDWRYHTLVEGNTPLCPATLYGRAKASLFELAAAAAPVWKVSFAWGRVFFPYGPTEKPGRLVSTLIDGLAARRPVACSAGTQARDFMHVDDVGRAFAELLDSKVVGPVNIASGEPRAVRELIEIVARQMNGLDLIQLGARPLQPHEPPFMAAATERLACEVGFKPRFSLEEGLRDTVDRRTSSNATAR